MKLPVKYWPLFLIAGLAPADTSGIPVYIIPPEAPDSYRRAAKLVALYGNSDEFYTYVKTKRTKITYTTLTLDEAITDFRNQLAKKERILVTISSGFIDTKIIGGWDGKKIIENKAVPLSAIDRAGHFLHETAHTYGYRHGNYDRTYRTLNSLPYIVGDEFKLFLNSKLGDENEK